jgi:16S rRNA (uracil1498-N3)-methyltransferase
MSIPRFHSTEKLSPGSLVKLSDNAAIHAGRALRMKVGDQVVLFNGDGNNYLCELNFMSKNEVSVKVKSMSANNCESPLNITLIQAISSGDRMDFTIQKAVELGVTAIQPISSQRSVVRLSGDRAEKRREHWQNVVISACEQSGRSFVPLVAAATSLPQWLSQNEKADLRILLLPGATQSLHDMVKPEGNIHLLIGAEGGLTEEEINLATHYQFASIRLGNRILRTETAALSAISAIQTRWGDFN